MADQQVSHQMEEYLEAMGRMEERQEAPTTSALARECGVSAPSVTQMLQKMSELGLVSYTPRGRVNLTSEGRRAASSVMRRHRLWERFLHDVLGLQWDSVHEEACRLEHATSDHVERHLAEALGGPDTCPHGHQIPMVGDEGRHLDGALPLTQLEPHQPARIARVRNEDSHLLRKLESLGLRPGVIVEREALSDTSSGESELCVRVGRSVCALDAQAAAEVLVSPLSSEELTVRNSGEESTLDRLLEGEVCRVKRLLGGRGFVSRCLALGFTPGTEVRVVQNCGRGPLIAQLRDVRVALGRGEAQRISVLKEG